MTLIAQNDLGNVADANSYVSLDYYVNYFAALNVALDDNDDEVLEANLIRATRYMDSRFKFRGYKSLAREQTTQWPRVGVIDREGYSVAGVPFEIKNALCEYAYKDLLGQLTNEPVTDANGRPIVEVSTSVGPLSETIKYAQASGDYPSYRPHQIIDGMLSGLLANGGSSMLMVTRA